LAVKAVQVLARLMLAGCDHCVNSAETPVQSSSLSSGARSEAFEWTTLDGRVYNEFPERPVEQVPDSGHRISLISAYSKCPAILFPLQRLLAID